MAVASTLRVLLYHHVHDGPDGSFRITPARFRRQMETLLAAWYVPVTLDRVLDAGPMCPLPANAVLITFDDAYEDVFEHARPILRELEVPATLFVITDVVGGTNAWDAGMPPHRHMTAEQIGALAREGWSIGSHSRTHPALTSADCDLEAELGGSREALERLTGGRVRALAYPGGHRDARVKAAAARHYSMGFSTDNQPPYPAGDRYDVPRFDPSYCAGSAAFLEMVAAGAVCLSAP